MKTRRSGMKRSFEAEDRASDAPNRLISSNARSARPMRREGRCRSARLSVLFGALGSFGEFLDDAVALELGDMVDEQDAVEVVDLVLDAGREQALGLDLVGLAVEVEILEPHLGGALDILVDFRDRQAAFLVDRRLVRGPYDLRIDEHARLGLAFLLGKVHGEDALRHPDLDRGEPDAGRVIHGFEHVLDQGLDVGRDLADRLGDQPQPLVGKDDDIAPCHEGRCNRCTRNGQQFAVPTSFASAPRIGYNPAMTETILLILAVLVVLLAGGMATLAYMLLRRPPGEGGDPRLAELARLQAETSGRLQAMGEALAGRQAELARVLSERLDSVST